MSSENHLVHPDNPVDTEKLQPEVLQPGAVSVRGVSKLYDRMLRLNPRVLSPWYEMKNPRRPVQALNDLDLEVAPGEALGIIGENGAGKSTLLKILAGVTAPSTGTARVGGRIVSMIELGLGFEPELTGEENLRITAGILGLTPAETRELTPAIIEFSDLADAMDQPMKRYSSGMQARLGFAVATHVPADILLVDEVLAVGDLEFQIQCIDLIVKRLKKGTTLVFVTHEMWLMEAVCTRTVTLQSGRVVDDGPTSDVIHRYLYPFPGNLQQSERPRARLQSFNLAQPELAPGADVDIEATIEVDDPAPDLSFSLEMNFVTIAPDLVIGRGTTRAPAEVLQPGRHHLTGKIQGLPLDSGHNSIRMALIDRGDHRVLDQASTDLWIRGAVSRSRPQLMAHVEWSCAEVPDVPDEERVAAATRADQNVIVAEGLGKRFRTRSTRTGIRDVLPRRRRFRPDDVIALEDVTFRCGRSESIGVIGPNGAGKSTLLRVLAGVTGPTAGTLSTHGRVVSMLDLGIGFHEDLTGRENLWITCRALGLSAQETAEIEQVIVDFSDLGDVVESRVRHYSTGMLARLGMALALHTKPDVLLIDEVLAVGDEEFRRKAIDRVALLRQTGTTVMLISHDWDLIAQVCERAIHIVEGHLRDDGSASDVIHRAGGTGETGGVQQLTGAVRLERLVMPHRHAEFGGDVSVSGTIIVVEPSPHVRLELNYHVKGPFDHPGTLDLEDNQVRTVFRRVVEPAPSLLTKPGRYDFAATIHGHHFRGQFYVVLTAIDERDGTVISRSWTAITVGGRITEERPWLDLNATWRVGDAPAEPEPVGAG